MISFFKNFFSDKPASVEEFKIIDRPDIRINGIIKGKPAVFDPQSDITPFEAAQINNMLAYIVIKSFRIQTKVRFDCAKFVSDYNLGRHFKAYENE